MTNLNLYLKTVKKKPEFFFVAVAVCLICWFSVSLYAQTQEDTPLISEINLFGNQLIDRVIPSKANDLFVVLKNGLTVLIRESHGSKAVSCRVLVKTGSIYEGSYMGAGLSHYLEHVVSGGTTSTLTESEIKERVQALGGASNAHTSYERTVYFIDTTGEHYKEAISLLMTYVTNCQFDEKEYQREKPVIIQEFQLGENNPSKQLWSLFMETAYREHPVRYPIIGEREIFLRMDKEDLMSHYRRWYTPDNIVISVVGDVDKEAALAAILELGGKLKETEKPPYVFPEEPPQLSQRRVEKGLSIAKLTQAQIGFQTIPLTDPDLYPLDILAVIMGDGRTSRLYRKVRDQKGLVLSISAGSWTPTFVSGQFLISIDLTYENLEQAIDAVWEELGDIKENLVNEDELKRAKKKVIADYVFSQESVQSQAGQISTDWVATGDPYFSEAYASNIQKVSPEDIQRVARKYFKKEKMTLAVIKPSQEESEVQATVGSGSPEQAPIQKIVLPNKMTLLLKKNPAAPIATFKFMVKGGQRFEPPDKPGISNFMASLLTKGTTSRSKIDIAKTIEDIGGSIGAGSGKNTVGVSVLALKEDFDVALDLLADVVLNPDFPEKEIDKQKEDTLLAIHRLNEEWTTEISRLFKKHYFNAHPYRNDLVGTAEAVYGFSRDSIRYFYDSIMLPNNAVLAIFGDIEPEEVVSKAEKAFQNFIPNILNEPLIEPETSNIQQDQTFTTYNEKSSAAILVGFNGLTIANKDVPVVNVLDAIISGIGYPSGWLHDALRGGDRSLVYFVHAYSDFGIDGGYFGVMTQTTVENYDEVLGIILDKMALIQSREVDEQTLKRAKDMCITMHELGLQKIAAQASSAAANEILGLGSDYDGRYPELIRQVTSADVLRVARELFSHHLIVSTKPVLGSDR